jgi:hypothetical protein
MLIFLALIFLGVLLVVLNAATYVQKQKVPDTEFAPNRSTYNSGSTGTQAFYSLLSETGRKVRRWQSELDTIDTDIGERPAVFVMIGPHRRQLTDVENTHLMKWVAAGGTLVLIDREPLSDLMVSTAQWKLSVNPELSPDIYTTDAANQTQMTANTAAIKPSFPSSFTHGVNAVQPSRFASSIDFERFKDVGDAGPNRGGDRPSPEKVATPTPFDFGKPDTGEISPAGEPDPDLSDEDPTPADPTDIIRGKRVAFFDAPVVHVGAPGRNLLVEIPFASGRVVVLSDPYIVSNAGIGAADNARLAVNVVTSRVGPIAFDEYHHGHGANNNRLFQYFEGTPVIALFVQCGLIVALVFFSQSRRFARPVPEPEPDRLSKLEYVSAMAELQQRSRAYDLAIENIYSDFRRRACSVVGLDNTTATRRALAERISERIGSPSREIEELLYRCEDVMYGTPVASKETVELVDGIRKLEERLGLRRAVRKGA